MWKLSALFLLAFSSVVVHADGDINACKYGTYKQMLNGNVSVQSIFRKKKSLSLYLCVKDKDW